MEQLCYLLIIFTSMLVNRQTKYKQGMIKAINLWEADKPDEASILFERIATAEKDNWLPTYYVAQIAIISDWKDFENRKEATMNATLDKAQEFINTMRTIAPDNPYADHLQAQLYTEWLAHDGMKYAGIIGELYQNMVNKEPENLIFIAENAHRDMGSARYFGSSIAPYNAELQRDITLFATFKPETKFHGRGTIKRALESAKARN